MRQKSTIPVIDIFAGPGGLGEGFSALTDGRGNQAFFWRKLSDATLLLTGNTQLAAAYLANLKAQAAIPPAWTWPTAAKPATMPSITDQLRYAERDWRKQFDTPGSASPPQ